MWLLLLILSEWTPGRQGDEHQDGKRGEPDGWRIKASKWLFLSINLFLGKTMLIFQKIGS